MSHLATTWAWKQELDNPIRKLILLFVADAANPEKDWNTWHSFKTIANACNCSIGSVSKHMAWLCQNEYLELIKQGNGPGSTNRYRLNVGDVAIQIGPKNRSSDERLSENEMPNRSFDERNRSSGELNRSSGVDKPVIQPVKEPVRYSESRRTDFEKIKQSVIDSYHEQLPWGRQVAKWTTARDRALKKLLKTHPETWQPGLWDSYFAIAAEDKFIRGEVLPRQPGQEAFKVHIDYMLREEVYVKFFERSVQEACA